jgi:membrane protease YdiL (CAAX protease family)
VPPGPYDRCSPAGGNSAVAYTRRLLPYVWLSIAILWLWLPPQASARSLPTRLGISAAWLLLSFGHAYWIGIVTPIAMLAILAFSLLCYAYARVSMQPLPDVLTTVATVVFSLALMAHVVPGFSNVLVVRDAALGPDAIPYTLFLNFDKAQIGLFLLAFGPPLIASRAEWRTVLSTALPRLLVVAGIVMVCALSIGQVRLDVKWPEFFAFWAWANLLFTCTAEEALFRGVIQRRLQGGSSISRETTPRQLAGLLTAGVLFGMAHYAGGVRAIVLATIAGIGYGWIYWRTNRIEASILAHFLLNTMHILLFTYPARV